MKPPPDLPPFPAPARTGLYRPRRVRRPPRRGARPPQPGGGAPAAISPRLLRPARAGVQDALLPAVLSLPGRDRPRGRAARRLGPGRLPHRDRRRRRSRSLHAPGRRTYADRCRRLGDRGPARPCGATSFACEHSGTPGASRQGSFRTRRPSAEPRQGELLYICTTPGNRRRGIGAALLRSYVEAAQRAHAAGLHLVSERDNTAAHEFYAHRGWQVGSESVTRDGRPLVRMTLSLGGATQ